MVNKIILNMNAAKAYLCYNKTFNVVEWLRAPCCDRDDIGSKPTRAIFLYHWEKKLYNTSPCLVVLASSSKFQSCLNKNIKNQNKKFQPDSNIWHLWKQVGVIACPMYRTSISFLQFRGIIIKNK